MDLHETNRLFRQLQAQELQSLITFTHTQQKHIVKNNNAFINALQTELEKLRIFSFVFAGA